ncbi:hypothetical protein DNU06_16970 [Putridiphycobacter roseus]|uniref:Uncharacterized protein n=1 Tax=Putridiphycobacter roseus TaxID=2219161 RepID=A0A2W1N9E4_9FLAO|nr:hypothetical protein [Putridiphycobacter roseus]PZE15663.1 hypothetical protein DNU06_16970 [Putridiphycobacter roseus]
MRFNKPAYPTVYFSEEIWVNCPKCSKPALVRTELPKYTIPFPTGHKSICNCNHCGFQNSQIEKWSGFVQGFVNRACGNCGTGFCYSTEPTRVPYNSTKITCEVCSRMKEYEIQWYRYRNDKATDPYFGFDLFLQSNIKDNILWLYNLNHLEYLQEYVEAKLRVDDGRHKYSMITNLPQWVKSSKNRDLVIKKLIKMKKDFKKIIQKI